MLCKLKSVFLATRQGVRFYSVEKVLHEWVATVQPEKLINFECPMSLRLQTDKQNDCNQIIGRLLAPQSFSSTNKSEFHITDKSDSAQSNDFIFDNNHYNAEEVKSLVWEITVPEDKKIRVHCARSITIENVRAKALHAHCNGDIIVGNAVVSETLVLESIGEQMNCGTLEAEKVVARIWGSGNMMVEKVIGKVFHAACDYGTLSVGSCTTDESKFITVQGQMDLQNVHSNAFVHLPVSGALTMTGFEGNLQVRSANSRVYLQLNRLTIGNSIIHLIGHEHATINLAENIDKETNVIAVAKPLTIADDMDFLKRHVKESGSLEARVNGDYPPSIFITSQGPVNIGRKSWIDSVKMQTR